MKITNNARFRSLAVAVSLMALAACSGNNSSSKTVTPPTETVKLNGYVSVDAENARVTAAELDYEGQPERIVDDNTGESVFNGFFTFTTDTGRYDVSLDEAAQGAPVILVATNEDESATAICQLTDGCGEVAWLERFSLDPELQIRSAVGEAAEGMRINLNWLTDLASTLATTVYIDVDGDGDTETSKTGFYSEYSIELSNLHLDELFNISDVISVTPILPSEITQETEMAGNLLVEALYYGALIAGIQQIAFDEGQTYSETIDELAVEFLSNNGQLYERDDSPPRLTMHRIYTAAAQVLDDNITVRRNNNARVHDEVDQVSADLQERIGAFVDGRLTEAVHGQAG